MVQVIWNSAISKYSSNCAVYATRRITLFTIHELHSYVRSGMFR